MDGESSSCSDINTKEKKSSFAHNTNISTLQRNIEQSRSQEFTNNDPLEQIDKIELVQQSDSTVHLIVDEEVSTDNNLSCLSIAPIQNLLGVFNENMDEGKKTIKNNSPNGVDQYEGKNPNVRDEESGKVESRSRSTTPEKEFQTKFCLEIPTFELDDRLSLKLSQPVINRCSFYSIIHGVNKAVQDMAAEDVNCNVEETKDEESALVRAVNGPSKSSSTREGPQVELAVLDEERFLLAAIENRGEEEMRIRACPPTFAEAIGEVEPSAGSDAPYGNSGQSENPLAVLSSSRTQLWKPSRSWWEAKSGKNPWIEPKLHNKRWRYLWPLIHYHKFLAKCIKKLKRNNVDVKTSLSPVAAFLREEVCAVSDHLAAASKFTSEYWGAALPHFHGWTAQDEKSQLMLKEICQRLPMRSLAEPLDVDSALLRNQIDVCFLKSWKAQKDLMENGAQERMYEDGSEASEFKAKGRAEPNQSFASSNNGSRPPRHGGSRGSRYNNRMSTNQRYSYGQHRHSRNQRGNRMYGGYPPHNHGMMMPPQMQHGMYAPPYNTSFHGSYVPGHHYMHQSMNNSLVGWNHYGGNDYSNLNISASGEWDQFHGNQYDGVMEAEQGSFFAGGSNCDDSVTNGSVASFHQFEGHPHYTGGLPRPPPVPSLDQRQVSNGSINQASSNNSNVSSFEEGGSDEPTPSTMQTPAKEAARMNFAPNIGTPASPSWAHLHMVPGLATPLGQHGGPSGPHMHDGSEQNQSIRSNTGMRPNQNWANAKPLFINPNFNHHFPQGPLVPPSPATQFTMSPQANSQSSAYFAQGYPRPNPRMQQQMSNVGPPMHQPYQETLDETTRVSGVSGVTSEGQTLTEETAAESISDTEN